MAEITYNQLKKNHLITGRGATAIYLALQNEGMKDRDVIIPGNICYAAVYPIISSGNDVVFCDVDPLSGNVTLEILKRYQTRKTGAVLVPHMYGNSVANLDEIKKWCEKNHILLIEDCASSLGSTNEAYGPVGVLGDYVIYSFGYSKIVDLGKGGVLASDRNLNKAESLLQRMKKYDAETEKMEDDFSAAYRKARYVSHDYKSVSALMNDAMFLYAIDDGSSFEKLLYDEELIAQRIEMHKKNYELYDSLLNHSLHRYLYNKGSVPWRFSLLLDYAVKRKIIDALLAEKLPVSDWYPNITEMFSDEKTALEGVDIMEEKIVNFPLDTDKETIEKICFTVNRVEDID